MHNKFYDELKGQKAAFKIGGYQRHVTELGLKYTTCLLQLSAPSGCVAARIVYAHGQ